MAKPSEAPIKDAIVAGKYRLVRLLGRGGMGSVWEGVHTTLGTQVAVKFIEAEFANQPEIRDRFFNEAFAAARLQSKHIVQVHDHGVDEGGRPYIVMEFLSGEPLDERLVREGTLSLTDAAVLLGQVARAIKKAHEAGIVHRDLKPENIFLVWDEEDERDLVKIVDFGIAKFSDSSGVSSATRTGAVLGTPHFMSPEQARGLKTVDERADVWSIGVIAYRAVTGVLPFDGEAIGDLLVKICTLDCEPPSTHVPVPEAFDDWVKRSLSKDVAGRFSSVEEQAAALLRAAREEGARASGKPLQPSAITAESGLGVERSARPRSRTVSPVAAAAMVSVVVLIGIVSVIYLLDRPAPIVGSEPPSPYTAEATVLVAPQPAGSAAELVPAPGPGPTPSMDADSQGGHSGDGDEISPQRVMEPPTRQGAGLEPPMPVKPVGSQPRGRTKNAPRTGTPVRRSPSDELGY